MNRYFLFIPVFMVFFYVLFFGVNVPFLDEWDLVPFVTGSVSFSDFFVLHNEHLMFFPRFLFLFNAYFLGFNPVFGMLVSVFLFSVLLFIFYVVARKQLKWKEGVPFWFLFFAFLLFNLSQYENFLWGFQFAFLFPLVFGVSCFYFLDKLIITNKFKFFVFGLVCALVAGLSHLHGLFVFLVGFFPLLFCKRKFLFSWFLVSVLFFVFYFSLLKSSVSSSFDFFNFFLFFFGLLGGVFHVFSVSFVFGLFVFSCFVYCLFYCFKRGLIKRFNFWFSVSFFGLLFCLASSFGRSSFGFLYSMSSRYVSFSVLVLLCVFYLFFALRFSFRKVLLFSCVFCLIASFGVGAYAGLYTWSYRVPSAYCLRDYVNVSDSCLSFLYPNNVSLLRDRAVLLDNGNLSVFSSFSVLPSNSTSFFVRSFFE